jgi:DNA-directed RNA polymerase specialized sigma24 family protein
MSLEQSITTWIKALKAGDSDALTPLWERYAGRLAKLARARKARLGGRPAVGTDEEDAIVSAFAALQQGLSAGQFPDLNDRDDLWKLMHVLTTRAVFNHARRERAAKRGGGHVRLASDLSDSDQSEAGLDVFVAAEASPEVLVQLAEETELLLDRLGNDTLRQVAIWKLEGYTNEEIRERLGCSLRTVVSRLKLIREIWLRDADGPGS